MSTDALRHHQFLETWEPFFADGTQLTANAYEHWDGRRHVYFLPQGDSLQGRESSHNVTRIAYRRWDEGTQFLGMVVAKGLRGNGLGVKLLQYFIEASRQHEGSLLGTGLIHKPLIALTLQRAGLQPESQDFMVEILPRSSADSSGLPKVQVLQQGPYNGDVLDRSRGGRFYDVIPPDEVVRCYPINDPDLVVALHTRYLVENLPSG